MTYNTYMKSFRFPLFFLLFITIFSPSLLFGQSGEFFRPLSLGSSGEDVKLLQMILNSSEDTRIINSGPGSPGMETDYFGLLTKNAVIRFQRKWSPEVLLPAGIALPTGYVGTYTLKKLKEISLPSRSYPFASQTASVVPDLPVPPLSASASPSMTDEGEAIKIFYSFAMPKLAYLSSYQASPGSKVTIYGAAFQKNDNSVCFGSVCVDNLKSTNGTNIDVTIPQYLPLGEYNVYVKNKNGTTYDHSFGNYFTVSNTSGALPKLSGVSPKKIALNAPQAISLSGEFEDRQVDIITSLGSIKNRGVYNDTVQFSINDLDIFQKLPTISVMGQVGEIPLYIYVKNSIGISLEPIVLYLSY
jgi:peptidoglycan hydrolase-like protein with peptidoglycan-binding domain